MTQDAKEYRKAEIESLTAWLRTFIHYMEIAIDVQSPRLAEIAVDQQDKETAEKILRLIEQLAGEAAVQEA